MTLNVVYKAQCWKAHVAMGLMICSCFWDPLITFSGTNMKLSFDCC